MIKYLDTFILGISKLCKWLNLFTDSFGGFCFVSYKNTCTKKKRYLTHKIIKITQVPGHTWSSSKTSFNRKMQLIFAVGSLKNRRDERRQGKEKRKTQQQKKKKCSHVTENHISF